MISVIVPTNRVGGIDLLLDSLARQTFKDFELILVDALIPYRSPIVTQAFPTKHIAPRDNRFPEQQYCRTMNTGIAHARGDILLYLCDYSWVHPTCLETHARLQAQHHAPITLDYRYVDLPPLKPGFGNYRESLFPGQDEESAAAFSACVNANSWRFADDVRSGRLDDFMWSIFAAPMSEEQVWAARVEHEHRPCLTAQLASDWNWCSFKNESFPTELVLEMNGCDEDYDFTHGYQDSEFSYRLRERGIRWFCGEPGEGLVTVVNPRPVMNIKLMPARLWHNRDLCFESKRAEFQRPVNPGFSLREWRERTLGRVAA